MRENLYYVPPSDASFDDLKKHAIMLWEPMGDEPSYSKGKIDRIKNIENIEDNFMYMVAMFDGHNQELLAKTLKPETRKDIRERMISGGTDPMFITF